MSIFKSDFGLLPNSKRYFVNFLKANQKYFTRKQAGEPYKNYNFTVGHEMLNDKKYVKVECESAPQHSTYHLATRSASFARKLVFYFDEFHVLVTSGHPLDASDLIAKAIERRRNLRSKSKKNTTDKISKDLTNAWIKYNFENIGQEYANKLMEFEGYKLNNN